jgi:hypothetical protein
MSTITCRCGTVYERTEFVFMARDHDRTTCQVCGEELESWNSCHIPKFRLIERPEGRVEDRVEDDTDSAASDFDRRPGLRRAAARARKLKR